MPIPDVTLSGSTLIVGPSNAGKTRLTAQTLDQWIEAHGPRGVVVLEFAPEIERDGTILGGQLTRFTSIPEEAFHGVVDAHAPRAESDDADEALALARENTERALRVLAAAPDDPSAVFVNDATIPLQADAERADALLDYGDRTSVAVYNAFESDSLGVDNPISRAERAALRTLRAQVDQVIELS